MRAWSKAHPQLWQFILFNVFANCTTVTNFVVMWFCSGILFRRLINQPFRFLFFDYTTEQSMMLCGFLSFLTATTAAQIVNYIVQKKLTFKSNVDFAAAVPKYIIMVIVLIVISAALPAYTQKLLSEIGMPVQFIPTVANGVNILMQVVISFPAMKFWIMPEKDKHEKYSVK